MFPRDIIGILFGILVGPPVGHDILYIDAAIGLILACKEWMKQFIEIYGTFNKCKYCMMYYCNMEGEYCVDCTMQRVCMRGHHSLDVRSKAYMTADFHLPSQEVTHASGVVLAHRYTCKDHTGKTLVLLDCTSGECISFECWECRNRYGQNNIYYIWYGEKRYPKLICHECLCLGKAEYGRAFRIWDFR
jgi:hypothetical protein